MKISCVVPSAGKGKRLKGKKEKPFIDIRNRPLFLHTVKALEGCSLIDEIIVVVSPRHLKACKGLLKKYRCKKVTGVLPGGRYRFDSVKNGLKAVKEADIILIHDGARPFVNSSLIKRVINGVKKYGAALCATPSRQTLKTVNRNSVIVETPKRKFIWEAQTPQGFRADLIKKAYKTSKDRLATDDSLLVERLGHKVKIVKGSCRNIKITTPEDLLLAKAILDYRP